MLNLSSRVGTAGLGVSLSLFLVLAGCGGSNARGDGGAAASTGGGGETGGTGGTGGTAGGDTGSSDAGTCAVGDANGTLSVKIVGAPADVASVWVAVATAPDPITADIDLTVSAGEYSAGAYRAADSTSPFRTAYEPSIDVATPCVRAGQTTIVTVTYAAIATSGKLWVGNSGTGKEMLGFGPASVAATGAHAADVAAGTKGSNGFTFDAAGNLWVLGATTADLPLARYRASTLATSGAKTPDVTLDSPSFGGGIPGATVAAFDDGGNLWVSVVAANKVVRFTPEQLAVTGTPTASAEISGINGPSGIAFNAAGSMFVSASSDAKIARFDKDQVYGSGTGAILANLMISASTPGPVIVPLTSPTGLAFDTRGNLWVNFDGTLVKLTPDDFGGAGTKTVTPAIQIRTDVLSLPVGIAFDSAGALWLAYSAGKLARLDASQLAASGTVAPAAVITSSDLAYAGWFAIYPAPAGTGLFHALP